MTQIRWGGKWVPLAYIWIVSHLSAKNYRNLWKFDEVLTKTNLLSFFWDTVYSNNNNNYYYYGERPQKQRMNKVQMDRKILIAGLRCVRSWCVIYNVLSNGGFLCLHHDENGAGGICFLLSVNVCMLDHILKVVSTIWTGCENFTKFTTLVQLGQRRTE